MLHKNSLSPFKPKKKARDENKCRYDGEKKSFKKGGGTQNHNGDKHYLLTADGRHRNSISKFPKDVRSERKEGTGKIVYDVKRDTFRPEIFLGNRIIEDLTCKYKAELLPLNSRYLKKEKFKREELLRKIQRISAEESKSFCVQKIEEPFLRNKKAVTFLDDKLKNGFTNAGFVFSPPIINGTDKNEVYGGIVNVGFISSPVTHLNKVEKRSVWSKPTISKNFLQKLNENAQVGNKRIVHSSDCSFEERMVVHDQNEENEDMIGFKSKSHKIEKKKMFVNQMKKISNRKSSGKENDEKQKKHSHGLLNRKKREGKCLNENEIAVGVRNKNLDLSSEEEISLEEDSSFKLSGCSDSLSRLSSSPEIKLDQEFSFGKQSASWNSNSTSKLPVQGQLNDVKQVEELQNRSNTIELVEKGMDFWVDGFKINNKKKLDKINKINIHLHALFSAVENGHVEKARTILESSDVDVNSVNGDNLTPLDVAVLTNHRSLVKMLVAFGAQEGNHFQTPEKLGNHLKNLLAEADRRVQELDGGMPTPEQSLLPNLNNNRASFSIINHYSASSITFHGGSGDPEKELLIWERRSKGLKKMLLGFEQTRPPDSPFLVDVNVTGTNSVNVRYQGPKHQDSSIFTKFKIQWSESENFEVISGEKEIMNVKCLECSINDLKRGKRYWFRVACGNLKGFGLFKLSTPTSVVPSSWRDVEGREPRFLGRLHQLDELFLDIRNLRPETASEIKDFSDTEKQGEAPAPAQRKNQKKKTIKHLFTVAGKFQKHLKRGIYLVCLFYHDDKILVTNEDFLPAIEVDETYPNSIYNDLHWFMKVACTWSDVKSLKQDMEKSLTSTTSHFRIKLLQAAQQMQSNLCTQDLGQLYYKPIRDAQGTLAFCSVNSCPSLKSISVLNLRWSPISKVQKKIVASEESNVGELLMASIQPQILYHQLSNLKLSKGLYLGYLKMKSSVDLIQIIVPTKTPNVLPHCKIRDNPHVSSDEWEWLKRINSRHKSLENLQEQGKEIKEWNSLDGSEEQQIFVEQVANTARRLFSYMDISLEEAMMHRLYDVEVIDVNSHVSFLIIVPPVETSCCIPGQKDILLEREDLMSVPLQVFEMVHLSTYQPEVISRYSRLSCILELDVILAQHSHREAFSSSEVQVARDRLTKLQELQVQLNGVWKSVRWIMDVITFARDRTTSTSGSFQNNSKPGGISTSQIHINKINSTQTCSLSTETLSGGIQNMVGVPVKHLLSLTKKKEGCKKSSNRISKSKCLKENHQFAKCEKRTLLQIPDSPKDPKILKSNVSRGSWPGPKAENSSFLFESSFSKSEQHLNILDENKLEFRHTKYGSNDHYVHAQNISNSSIGSNSLEKCDVPPTERGSMSNIGNQMLFSRSEDHLFSNLEFKQLQDYRNARGRSATVTTTSVSASNSPLLPQKNLYESNLNRVEAGSSLSIANTNTSGSLHSISSDESTAAVVSLPVTTPFLSNSGFNTTNSVQHSASLMSLAKPILLPNSIKYSKSKIPVTISHSSLTEINNVKRATNASSSLVTSSSILSGNTIPVNINQKPLKTTTDLSDINLLDPNISSSVPTVSKHSSKLTNINPFTLNVPGKQLIQSSVKPPIKAVSPIDTVLSEAMGMKKSGTVEPFLNPSLPSEIDLLHHVGLQQDSSVNHRKLTPHFVGDSSEIASSKFVDSGTTVSYEVESKESCENVASNIKVPGLSSGVLQVYAAYETGLAAGTSLKLHVTPRTSAREVVDLVVKQLNMAVLLKGKDGPIYSADKLKNFCLVAVIGARERCLRDDFKPLQLQNPWKKGRLYVRQKQDVLAALEHSSKQSVFL